MKCPRCGGSITIYGNEWECDKCGNYGSFLTPDTDFDEPGEEQIVFRREINGVQVKAFYSRQTVETVFLPLLCRLTEMQRKKQARLLVFLAAPPAAGKSTLAAFLEELSRSEPEVTPLQAIGMDGFHRYQEELLRRTAVRNGEEIPMVRIKGAPITFDLERLRERIAAVAAGENCPWPVYDRQLHNPRENALTITGNIVLLEGNYLLLNEPGWQELKQYADYTVFIEAAPVDLRRRLIWRKAGTSADSIDDAVAFVEFSDLPNALTVLEHSQPADLNLKMLSDGSYTAV